ncbi:CHAT domain-containing protein [Shimia aestuarii]|uniref:CHAT domain-containing protein n=1 Tax=Shimia aestuarii TaxID=254406 RepID=UPI001041E50B|nr:CHAT domain-containing protein [Shimia aestuarii]
MAFLPLAGWAQDMRQVEQNLSVLRFDPGNVDGIADARTSDAITAFQFSQGLDATGRLSPWEASYLARIAANAGIQAPFITELDLAPDETSRKNKRMLFANGLHYAATVRYRTYNKTHASVGSERFVALMDSNGERRRGLMRDATALAQQSRNPLAIGLMHLSSLDETETEIPDTQRALETLLQYARSHPEESAYGDRALSVVTYYIPQRDLCEAPESDVLRALVAQSLTLPIVATLNAENHGRLVDGVLVCTRGDARDHLYESRVAIAREESQRQVFQTGLTWAADLARRGNAEAAQSLFQQATQMFLDDGLSKEMGDFEFDQVFPYQAAVDMVRLGMTAEVARIIRHNRNILEAMDASVGAGSYAFASSYDGFLTHSSQLSILARDFAGLKWLGAFLHDRKVDNGGFSENPDTARFNAQDILWGGARIGLYAWSRSVDKSMLLEAVPIVLPEMLRDGALEQALWTSLQEANAALEIGNYEVAEPAILRGVSIAQTSGAYDQVGRDIQILQRQLNLSRLEDLTPAQRLLEQMDIYYTDACKSLEAAKMSYEAFIDVDYAALADDPEVRRAVVDANAMNRLLGCFFPQRLTGVEARLLCAIAGFSDRKDVAEYVLAAQWDGIESWNRYPIIEQCVYGLFDAGRQGWIRVETIAPPSEYDSNALWFITQTPQKRAQLIEEATTENLDFGSRVDMQLMEKPLARMERMRIAEVFHTRFAGSFGRIGPSKQDVLGIRDAAIAFQRMGYFGTAEIYFANDQRVDPFAFGTEDAAKLDTDLLRPEHTWLRLRYSSLYRDWGKPDLAYAAIGPLAERAIERLGSSEDPLPGTVEQWARRLKDLFIAYLELQFDDLPQGPNYPAIFAIQQYLQLARSTASASVLEQRLNSANPAVAREYQDVQRALRAAMRDPAGQGAAISDLSLRLQAMEAQMPETDAALRSHQIGVTRPLREVMLSLRSEGAAMLVVTQLSDSVVLMLLDGREARARRLDLNVERVQAAVTGLRHSIVKSTGERDIFDQGLASQLYHELIGWAYPDRPPPRELRLVTTGPFATLPFAALRHEDGWLGVSTILRASPSVARGSQAFEDSSGTTGFIGLGDPNLTEGDVAGRSALLGAGGALAELPETAAELAFMAIVFGGNPKDDVFTKERASERQMQALNRNNRLAEVSVLALATHGLLSRETGALESSGLVLSLPQSQGEDGILTANEIYGYRIGAELVILSACNTGTPDADRGLSDLASAFLYAGAGAMMLTHWEIDSGAGVELTKRVALEHRMAQSADYAFSLRVALEKMLSDQSVEKFHHPRFWASHFILG